MSAAPAEHWDAGLSPLDDRVLLQARRLSVRFAVAGGTLTAVDGVDLDVRRGEILGIVGESGSGKSVTMLALTRLVSTSSGTISADELTFEKRDLRTMPGAELRAIRGRRIGFIFQNPLSSLNPLLTIGEQIAETLRVHLGLRHRSARARAVELLARVGIPDPKARVDNYPHQFSGGMRQRAMIAMAIACEPSLILADEPTTALDVTIQAQILELLQGIVEESGAAVVLVTHDLGIAAGFCQRVNVMYAGQIVEAADVKTLFSRPMMPYTWGLLDSIPRFDQSAGADLPMIPGMPPNPLALAPGCRFADRCAFTQAVCVRDPPPFTRRETPSHVARCWGTESGGWLEVEA
jgi:oligopeptide/dipeptide ABC transporter ATP-binding protein